jgi:lysine-specific demethylase 8
MVIAPVERIRELRPEVFFSAYHRLARPVIITNSIRWPALNKWTHEWFRDTYGEVVVELSCNPTHTHKPVKMRLGEYMQRVIDNYRMEGGLYLDQFPLSRIPALSKDFSVPPYCSRKRQIMPHLWVGPGTTVLSFHKDNHGPLNEVDNIFVQIRGRKRVILASPQNDPLMYPRSADTGAYWHSQVNPEAPDFQKFPLFETATLLEGIVGPGDVIYIPRNYWHYVRALERSISMSFWWNPCRLMEVARLLVSENEPEIEELRLQGETTLTDADITEFGGVARLESAFAEFPDLSLRDRLCSRLAAHADQPARRAIETALAAVRQGERP